MALRKILVKRLLSAKPSRERNGRFFILVEADGVIWQVKINVRGERSNQNECIAHLIGSHIGAPVTEGAFLRFSRTHLDKIADYAKNRLGITVDMSEYRDNTLFGVRWHKGAATPVDDDQVRVMVGGCANKKDFFAVFAFDQYLRNYDRQPFNHLFISTSGRRKPRLYTIIDEDRIFGSTRWDRIEVEKRNENCFNEPFHRKLYEMVDDSGFTEAFKFAAQIDCLPESDIDDIITTLRRFYAVSQDDLDKVETFLKHRKSRMITICNGSCFPNVAQKRLMEDGA